MMPLRTLRTSFVLFFVFGFIPLIGQLQAATVSITTFNIRMYGYRNDSEVRDPELRKFISNHIPASDIMVFEEIMDAPRFRKLMPESWTCLSYDHLTPHQFVFLCHSPRFSFKREPTDNNDVIDDVSGVKGTLRPAVTAIVADQKGNPLFRMVAVHLKALPEYSHVRLDQTETIARWLNGVKDPSLPVVVTGDFNTYTTEKNGMQENDTVLMQKIYDQASIRIKHVPLQLNTYRTSYGPSQFDHFFVSPSLKLTKPLKVFDICNTESPDQTGVMNLDYYNKMISDHCPVTAEISY